MTTTKHSHIRFIVAILLTTYLFAYGSITVSSAWELTSVSMCYSQGEGVNTSLSMIMYCTHIKSIVLVFCGSVPFLCGVYGYLP